MLPVHGHVEHRLAAVGTGQHDTTGVAAEVEAGPDGDLQHVSGGPSQLTAHTFALAEPRWQQPRFDYRLGTDVAYVGAAQSDSPPPDGTR